MGRPGSNVEVGCSVIPRLRSWCHQARRRHPDGDRVLAYLSPLSNKHFRRAQVSGLFTFVSTKSYVGKCRLHADPREARIASEVYFSWIDSM
jgi:hypothetical protein